MRRSSKETVEEAKAAFKVEIKSGMDNFVTNGIAHDDPNAWDKLGETLHGISDSFCPSHKGFQYYFQHTNEFTRKGNPIGGLMLDVLSHNRDDASKEPTDRNNAVEAMGGIIESLIDIKNSSISNDKKKVKTAEVVNYWEEKYNDNL